MDTQSPAAPHRPIMLAEVLQCLRPAPGEIAVDCTLGGGAHAEAILRAVLPGGRLVGLDVDSSELPATASRLIGAGFDAGSFEARHANFADLPGVLAAAHVAAADVILADLGISMMQARAAARGFSYKQPGPLDMRLDPGGAVTAADLLAQLDRQALADLLRANADEPHAALIAGWLADTPVTTAHALERVVRTGLTRARPDLPRAEVKMSVRRTFQALRIAVNDEFAALDALLEALPGCLARGGRVAILTFHSGEDRRVKHAFRSGARSGVYSAVADRVIRSGKEETFADRRAAAAKLRWAVRA
ncbi:MAG: 16S rRNA (cytosine(1402)-N(4))-methyltransferase RsmH [Vicinamibacterales bacterium]